MPYWNVTAPDYVAPTLTTPAWVWSIAGWGRNNQNGTDSVILRLDYVKLNAAGGFERVLNFRPGWSSGGCTQYIPIFMNFDESAVAPGTWVGGYDYFMTAGVSCNTIWKNYIYKFLKGMMSCDSMTIYIPV